MAREGHSEAAKARVLALTKGGTSARDAAAKLAKEGLPVPWRTIARWEADRRKSGHAPAQGPPPATPPRAQAKRPAAPRATDPDPLPPPPPGEAVTPESILADFQAHLATLGSETDPTVVDVVELAALCQLLTRHVALGIGVYDWKALKSLFEFRALLSKTLAAVRPPEKVDPATDPTNLDALGRLQAKMAELRDAAETSLPVLAALRAHVTELERRAPQRPGSDAAV